MSLDWRDPKHWSPRRARCQHCEKPTWLRDDHGIPAHKVCAEEALRRTDATSHTRAISSTRATSAREVA